MKKKLFPKSREPPSAMLDSDGVILTTNKAIERRALEAYTLWFNRLPLFL